MCKAESCLRFVTALKDIRVNCLTCALLDHERAEEIKREQIKKNWNKFMDDMYSRECVPGER